MTSYIIFIYYMKSIASFLFNIIHIILYLIYYIIIYILKRKLPLDRTGASEQCR